jgi:hypothetical protein
MKKEKRGRTSANRSLNDAKIITRTNKDKGNTNDDKLSAYDLTYFNNLQKLCNPNRGGEGRK